MVRRWRYRVWQFWQILKASQLPEEAWDEIKGLLNPAEQELFARQTVEAQQHGYRVMKRLKSAGHHEQALLAAALLHDVGKSFVRVAWWDRPVVVLGQALLPRRAAQWCEGDPQGWRRPFVVKAAHADWGAEAAEKSGSSAVTVDLIRRHQELLTTGGISDLVPDMGTGSNRNIDRLLTLLQWADNKS